MLRIALCDDQPEELAILNTYLSEYLSQHSLEAELRQFQHPDELLQALKSENFHIYILDIVMPMISGLELGRELRRLDREAHIIYSTTEPQFALQAYGANPVNYLIKPVDPQQLFETLSLAISRTDLSEDQTLAVRTPGGLRVLRLSDLLFCEYKNHSVVFTLKNGEEIASRTIRESFSDYIAPILENRHFLRCHSAFVINMRFIEKFTKSSFTMRGNKDIPVAKGQYTMVRDVCMDYLMTKEASL